MKTSTKSRWLNAAHPVVLPLDEEGVAGALTGSDKSVSVVHEALRKACGAPSPRSPLRIAKLRSMEKS